MKEEIKCKNCLYLTQYGYKSNYVCSIEKIKNPGKPEKYVKEPEQVQPYCSYYKNMNKVQ